MNPTVAADATVDDIKLWYYGGTEPLDPVPAPDCPGSPTARSTEGCTAVQIPIPSCARGRRQNPPPAGGNR